jgi:membrane fusion protein, multidrug efflux system
MATRMHSINTQRGRAPSNPLFWMVVVAMVVSLTWWYPRIKEWLLSAPLAPAVEETPGGAPAGAPRGGPPGFGGFGGGRFGFGGARPQPVSVASVLQTDITSTVSSVGTLTALNTAVVRSKVDGELKAIRFAEGRQVKAGEILAEIDPRPYEVQVMQAQGQLTKDQALLKNAELDAQRYKELWAQDAIAKQQLDTQEALVRQLLGTVQTDQALLESAKLNLSYTKVVAPISGKLGLKTVELGSLVRSGDPTGLVTITQTQPMAVLFSVPEMHVGLIQKKLNSGQTLPVVAFDKEQKEVLAKGVVQTSDNAIDLSTSTLKLKAVLENKDGRLFPNQFANIQLQLDVLKQSIVVPVTAIQRGSIGTFVLVVQDDKTVRTQRVQLLALQGDLQAVQIPEGQGTLKAGQWVVTDGADRLRDNSRVEVVKVNGKNTASDGKSGQSPGNQQAGGNAWVSGEKMGEGKGLNQSLKGNSLSNSAAPSEPQNKNSAGSNAQTMGAPASGPNASASNSASNPGNTSSSGTPPSGEGAPERPRWMDRLPPEMVDKIKAMSPEERRAFFQKLRERRQSQGE